MRKKYFAILTMVLSLVIPNANGQVNLVPNPSFEVLTSCPVPLLDNQIYLAAPWFSASTGTPDVFNSCVIDGAFGVPNNGIGGNNYQPSRTGNGYAGIGVYGHNANLGPREYLEVPLLEKLSLNHQYYIRFFVSTSNSSINDAPCYCDGIGAAFTLEKHFNNTGGTPLFSYMQPAIDNQGKILSDTVNWTPVSGCFINTETEKKYLIIGNFRGNDQTLASPGCDLNFPNNSYLYIEDVGVWEFDPLPDTVFLCQGESKMFNASFLNATYKWSNGSTDSTFSIFSAGVYGVSADMGDCVLSDTVVVNEVDEQPKFQSDTLICHGDQIRLLAPMPGEYEWSTGSKSSNIEITDPGIYTLTVINECGTFHFESQIETEDCGCPIFIPNVFSPDSDGQNDELLVFAACDFPIQVKQFQVFDRWGDLVYTSANDTIDGIRWDGLFQGRSAPFGVYVWFLEYTITKNGQLKAKHLQGDVTILR